MGDMAIVPCHRTSYAGYNYGKFKVSEGQIIDIEADNIENCIAGLSFDADTLPICESCIIKYSCSHGCLGMQLETVGDMYIPNPNVCRLEHQKVSSFVKILNELGVYNDIIPKVSSNIANGLNLIKELIKC